MESIFPRCLRRWCIAAGCLQCAWGAGSVTSAPYGYEDIVSQYCHPAMDWGPLPQRPDNVTGLLQVQVFVRHGARTQCAASPACWDGENSEGNFSCKLSYLESSIGDGSSRPMNPLVQAVYLLGRNQIAGNCMTGQLVEDGFKQHVNNGLRLREAYIEKEHLLPESLEGIDEQTLDRKLFFRSSDVPRTKQSGMALLSGLLGREVHGPPFPKLRTMDYALENMLVNSKVCSAVGGVERAFFESLDKKESFREVCKALALDSGNSDAAHTCFLALGHRVDCLMSRICPTVPFHPKNETIPAEYLKDDAALLRRVWKEIDEAQFMYFKALSRVGSGPFIAEVLSAADHALEGRSFHPFMLFSGHDTGPMEPLYAAFDLRREPPYWPTFASMLVLEIWNSSKGPLTRWISNGRVVGDGLRPYKEFQKRAKSLIPTAEECQQSKTFPVLEAWVSQLPSLETPFSPQLNSFHLALSALGGSVFTLLLVAAGRIVRQRKARRGRLAPQDAHEMYSKQNAQKLLFSRA